MTFRHIAFFFTLLFFNKPSYSQVIDYSTKIYIENGVQRIFESYKINVANRENRDVGNISIGHDKSGIKKLEGSIIDNNGTCVYKLKKKDVYTVSKRSKETFFQDNNVTKFNLHWHNYPYQIAYSYEDSYSNFFSIVHWSPVVFENLTTEHSSIELHIPQDYKINIYSLGELQFDEELTSDGTKKLKWQFGSYKLPDEEEIHAPPIEELMPQLIICPDTFRYNTQGANSTWSSFGSWFSDLNSGADILPTSEKKQSRFSYLQLPLNRGNNTRLISLSPRQYSLCEYINWGWGTKILSCRICMPQ